MSDLHTFGEWELKRRLGTGGFGEVLLWKNRRNNLEIATKRLKENKNLLRDEVDKLKQRWQQEYKYLQDMKTEYIVHGVEVKDDLFVSYLNENHAWRPLPVIIMEYCNGGDLRAYLQLAENMLGLHEFEVREVMRSLRYAIEYLHNECRIEHRDLKPDNIVMHNIGGRRYYKLTDFGFARKITENTNIKSVVGTRNYFAPEVVDTAQYTKTVDYWSLGVIAFELICGILPFIPHQAIYKIIVNIKKKPQQCIAITENYPHNEQNVNEFSFHTEIFPENRMTDVFIEKITKWLRLALDTHYKTRGTSPPTTDEIPNVGDRVLKFYTDLDAILESKILTIFCLNTYQYTAVEVTESHSMLELINTMEEKTKLSKQHFYLVFPIGHPRAPLAANTRPIDIFVDEWQNTTTDSLNPPVMLYLVGYQCEYKAPEPHISDIVKQCLRMNATESMPDWLLQSFEHHTHYLLANEQRHLNTFIAGLKEYALSVENEVFNFGAIVQTFMGEILLMRGSVKQFHSTITTAKVAHEKKIPNGDDTLFETWLTRAVEFNDKINKTDHNIGQSIQKRYTSALRRIKEEATNNLFDEWLKMDIYQLKTFRHHLQYARYKLDKKTRLNLCQKSVYHCLEKRNGFLSNQQLNKSRCTIVEVHQEFRKILEIVQNARKYLARLDEDLSHVTLEFHNNLFDMHHMNVVGSNLHDTTKQMNLTELGTAAILQHQQQQQQQQQQQPINGDCTSIMEIFNLPTKQLIQEAMENLQLMDIDVDDRMNDIPTTIDCDET